MADALLDSILGGGKKGSTGDPLLDSILNAKEDDEGGDPILREVLSGKPKEAPSKIWEGTKSAGRAVIDVLSRPNYAVAGAAEELFTDRGGGLGAAVKRAGTELFSGIGGLKGQKEGFAQVMEQSGVGELGSLSKVLPFLYNETGEGLALQRGGWADPTGRGAVGLAGDIFLDPTTYITAGGSAARRFLTAKGVKYLSREGTAAKNIIAKEFADDFKAAMNVEDDVARVNLTRKIEDAFRSKVSDILEADPKRFLDPTGVKWFGQEFISSKTLDGLNDTAKKVVTSVPGGALAAQGAEAFGRQISRVFNPYADLAGLPADMKDGMKAVLRANRSAAAMHKTNLFAQWAPLEKDYAREAAKYGKGDAGKQTLGKKFADWREQTGAPSLSVAETELFSKIAKIYDDNEIVVLREGLIDPAAAAKYQGKYLHHEYKNPEVLSETAKKAGRMPGQPVSTEQFQRSREFDTYDEAVRVSKALNEESAAFRQAGGTGKVYGELIPEYDAMKNLGSYIQQTTDSIWRKQTYQEARDKFGILLGGFDAGRRYNLDTPRIVRPEARASIDAVANGIEAAEFKDLTLAKNSLSKLSNSEQKELARELVSRAKSPSQVVNVRASLGDELMPPIRVQQAGEVEPYFAKLGQDGTLVSRSGGLWGDKELLIPQQIANIMENAPGDIVRGAWKNKEWKKFISVWDGYNNLFKMVTYPFYPSGAVRDTYNNVMQSFLGIGVGGFARPFQAARVLRGHTDDVLRLGTTDYAASELKKLAQDLGVTDPTAASFVQFTGERGAEKAGFLKQARILRGQVDNASRTQLWINNIAAGMTPQDAAQVVKDFLFDYGELSPFDRDIMRRAMPFYVFPRKAIETYGKAAIKTPGRVINLAKPFRGREDENNSLTTWEGEGFKVRLDRDGKTLTMLNGVDLPVRSLDMLWRGSPRKTLEGLVAMASPAIKVPYEAASGRDPFRGQEFGRQQYYGFGEVMSHAPKGLQQWAGYKEERDAAGRPKYTMRNDRIQMLAEASLLSRVLSTSERAFREQLREPNTAARWLDYFTGLRYKTLNLDEEQQRRVQAAEKAAQEQDVLDGRKREFRKVYTPKGQ